MRRCYKDTCMHKVTITATRLDANGPEYARLCWSHIKADATFLDRHGYGGDRLVFQVEYDLLDCPLLRLWWLTGDELDALPIEIVSASSGVLNACHVDEVAIRGDLPAWWRPDLQAKDAA